MEETMEDKLEKAIKAIADRIASEDDVDEVLVLSQAVGILVNALDNSHRTFNDGNQ